MDPIYVTNPTLTEPRLTVVPIDTLIPDPDNPNEGTDRTVPLLDYSLSNHGFLESSTLDRDNSLVGGNKRIAAARRAGYTHVAIIELPPNTAAAIRDPTLDLDSPDPEVRHRSRRASYALNHSAIMSIRLNPAQVESDIRSGIDLSGLMTKRDLTRLGVQLDRPISDIEAVPYEPPDDPSLAQSEYNVTSGSVWRLGRHTLACGDARDPALLASLISRCGSPAFCVTSPPYGVGKDYEVGGLPEWRSLIRDAFTNFYSFNINTLAVNLGDRHTGNDGWEAHTYGELVNMLSSIGYSHLNTRVWVKQPAWSQTPYWRMTYKTVDEFEYIGVFAAEKPKFVSRLTDEEANEWGYRSVWNINSVQRNDIHSAMFPLELPVRLIRLHTDIDDLIFEPFCGSGTTIIAAEAMRRTALALELSPEYCAVAIKRFHEVTKIEPILES